MTRFEDAATVVLVKSNRDQRKRLISVLKTFCSTGPGGGVDPTCGSGNGSRSGGGAGKVPNPKGADSFEQHTDPKTGTWSKERQKLHKEIIDAHFEGKTPVKNPTAIVLGGGPASGKTSVIKSGHVVVDKNTVHVDADGVKAMIPEYKSMLEAKDPKAAVFAHEESSYLANEIQKRASSGGYNSLLDGTGNSNLEKLKGKIDKMRESGQKVVAQYVTVDTEVAVQRNLERAKKTGRLPPESMLRACHKSVSEIVPKALDADLFDEFNLYDTSGAKVEKVASKVRGKKLEVHDSKLWTNFLDKAK